MAEPFLGQISLCSFNFAPRGWALCDGQLLPINQNQALFSILGTTYGGDGRVNFALPDLRGRIPLHFGTGVALGEKAGESAHTLTMAETAHSHTLPAFSGVGTTKTAAGNFIATPLFGATAAKAFSPTGNTALASTSTSVGGSLPHDNMMPYLTINFIIALQGIFPSRS